MVPDRKLINYLPLFMQKYTDIQKVMEAEQPEIDSAWTATENALADQYIHEATENGVSRWESMLGIPSKGTDTLDERKFRILARSNQELPYTFRKLEQFLTILCGANGYFIELDPANYNIQVKLALTSANNYQDVVDLLTRMLPANMMQTVSILYNRHDMLNQFTHAELSAYTHDDLRKEVFE